MYLLLGCILNQYFKDWKVMENLAVKHGYYFLIERSDEDKYLHVEIGKAYRNDDVTNFSIKSEDGFLSFYVNGHKDAIRDQDLSKSFEEVSDDFIERIVEAYGKIAVMKMENGKFVQYFAKEEVV